MTERSSSHDAFRRMRDARLPYVDKSGFIAQVIDCGAHVALLMRPRRFGRSLAVSMLRDYFEKSDRDASHLFADLRIWEMGEPYREHLTAEEISRGSYDYPEFRVTIPNEAMARSVASMRVGSMVQD